MRDELGRRLALLAFAGGLFAACGDAHPAIVAVDAPSATAAAADPTTAEIYATVIRELVTVDHTFGAGPTPFKHVWVVDGPVFTAMRVCESTAAVTVFRIAGHPEFDSALGAVAREESISVEFVTSVYPTTVIDAAAVEVLGRRTGLAERGATLVHTSGENDGRLNVGIAGDMGAAQQFLSDLGDVIRIVPGERAVVTPG